MRLKLPQPLPRSDRHRLPLKAAQNKQTPRPPPACPSHVSFFWVTGLVAEQQALHFSLCFQKRQAPHCPTCTGKLWLAACSAKVCEAPTSNVSKTLPGSTFAVAAVPASLTLPSSEDSPEHFPVGEPSASVSAALEGIFSVALSSGLLGENPDNPPLCPRCPMPPAVGHEETSDSEELDDASDSEVRPLGTVAAGGGPLPASDPREAAKLLELSSADSSADAAADLLAEPSGSGSETIFDGDASSLTVAAGEVLPLVEELSASPSLEDIAAWPRKRSLRQQPSEQKKTTGEKW